MKKRIHIFILLFCAVVLASCQHGYVNHEDPVKWAKLMADAYMQKCDSSLTHYDDSWAYDVAFLARTYEDLYQKTHEKKYREMFTEYMEFFVSDSVVWDYKPGDHILEAIQPARNLFAMLRITHDKKYERVMHQFIRQLEEQPRNAEGGYWHRSNYPNQMLLDDVYMICPFMVQYARKFNAPQWYDEAVKQITLIYEHTRDAGNGLCRHGWDQSCSEAWSDSITGQSATCFGRSMGWFCAGIVDVLDDLPKQHPGRPELIRILQETMQAVVKVQDPQYKLWYTVLDQGDREKNYMEFSASSLFIYALAKGARKGYLPASYRDIAKQAYDYAVKLCTKWYYPDGSGLFNVYYISASSGLGQGENSYRDGSYTYYTSLEVRSNDPKGTAPFMAASLELSR